MIPVFKAVRIGGCESEEGGRGNLIYFPPEMDSLHDDSSQPAALPSLSGRAGTDTSLAGYLYIVNLLLPQEPADAPACAAAEIDIPLAHG